MSVKYVLAARINHDRALQRVGECTSIPIFCSKINGLIELTSRQGAFFYYSGPGNFRSSQAIKTRNAVAC